MRNIHKIFFSLLIIPCLLVIYKSDVTQKKVQSECHPALRQLPVPNGWGVNIHFYQGKKNDIRLLRQSGIGIVRMDVSWSRVERKSGEYDFSQHDQLMCLLDELDLRLILIINYGNPLYDDGLSPFSDDGRAAYAKFCAALAKRYAGRNIIWELWNEPNITTFWKPQPNVYDYLSWCQSVVPAIRENDPGACIIAPATSSIDIPFMESCFQQGLLDLIDGVSIHPYRSQQLGPETAADEYCALKTLIAHYVPPGKSMPIISGEWGYSATVVSPLQQGKYLARQWLSNMANDIPISIWYDWHDDGVDPNNAEHNFGTVNWDYSPKPAFFAMKTITHYFQDFEFLGRMDINNANDYFLIFFKNDQYKIALWTTAKEHEIELAEDLQVIHLVDFLGQAIAQPSASPIKISDQPIYMTVPAQVPHWLNRLASAEKLTTQESENISRVFLADISGEDFVDKLKASIKEGNKFEQQAAFMVLGKIAAKTIDSSLRLRLFHFILQNANAELIIKNSLQAVAAMASPQSKVTVDHLFENPVFKPDLTNYYLQMAFTYAKEKKFEAADSLLEKAVSFSRHRYSVDRILAKMEETGYKIKPARQRQLSQKAGFISSWWIAGPFPNENNQAEKIAYFPEDRIDFSQVQKFDSLTATWQPLELDEVFAIIPLAKLFGKKQQAAYAYAELNLPSAIPAKFKIGSNDGVVCWLNGKKVHENLVGRALTVDEDEVEVYLKAGVNKILLKIPNRGANWEACLRVCDEKGAPMDVGQFILNKAK